MVFNSFSFLFAYLPVVLLLYAFSRRFLPERAGVWLLLMASFVFYGWNYPSCVPVLLGSLLLNVLLLKGMRQSRSKKGWLWCGIILHVAVLVFFKYGKFVFETENAFLKAPGISFFTFTQIAFLVESYRGSIAPVKTADYCLYVSFFPKLMQGPIMLPGDWQQQMQPLECSDGENEKYRFAMRTSDTTQERWEKLLRNLILISFGLFKKVILADTLGGAVTEGFGNVAALNSIDALVVMLSYTLQLYFDFSGYCDIATGIAAFFGWELPLNFNSPYRAENIMDFWKRWHITLTGFLTRYVYIPLGGNRKGTLRMYLNFLIVFLVSGIWHGAGWQFVVWGLLHGALYVVTRALRGRKREQESGGKLMWLRKGIRVLLTFLYVNVAWVFFRAASVQEAVLFLKRLFTGGRGRVSRVIADAFNLDEFWYVIKLLHLDRLNNSDCFVMVLFLIASLGLVWFSPNAVRIAEKSRLKPAIVVLAAVLFVWSVLSFSGVSTFLYFNF